MTTTELLDKAASTVKDGKRIAVVASTPQQRETYRKGLARRLGAGELASVQLLSPHSAVVGVSLDAIFVEPAFWSVARSDDMRWFDSTVLARLAAGGHFDLSWRCR